jgi:SAM-dependent methyltransferase
MKENQCPICHHGIFSTFFHWEDAVVQQQFLMTSRDEALHCRRANIELAFCGRCGAIWNMAFDPQLLDYSARYEATQMTSPAFRSYLMAIAQYLTRKYSLHGKRIVDIGCGDGQFLRLLCELGDNHGLGFEPSWRAENDATLSDRVKIIPDYYSPQYSNAGQPHLVACRHVLEHVIDPVSFLRDFQTIDRLHAPVFFFEVPNVSWSLHEFAFWDFYYEHCLYYCAPTLSYLFESCGFDVKRARQGFGEQYVWVESTFDANRRKEIKPLPTRQTQRLARAVKFFKSRYHKNIQRTQQQLFSSARQRMVIWGAGAKAVAFLNILNMQSDRLEYVVDINPRKWGTYLPGTGQEIVAPKRLLDIKPDIILVMNPQYFSEVDEAVKEMGSPTKLQVIGK